MPELSFIEQARRRLGDLPPTFIEQVKQRSAAEQPAAQQENRARIDRARFDLESHLLPGVRSAAVQAGIGFISPVARLIGKGDFADKINRWSGAIEQATREREEGGFPDILQRGARGAVVSLATIVPAASVAGPYGAIAAASAQEANSAITQGRDAGLKGRELAGFAVAQGVWEGIPASIMQKVGLGGVESMFGKRAVASGIKAGLKRMGVTVAQELPEEIVTELGHSIASNVAGVDPDSLSKENLAQTVADTTVQTLITVGFGGAPGLARSVTSDVAAEATEEMLSHAREGTTPSRKTWKKVGLAPELGESAGQRKAFSEELAKQFEETTAAPAEVAEEVAEQPVGSQIVSEADAASPTGPVETPLGEEVSEVVQQQEAATEAPGAVDLDKEVALNKATNIKIRETVDLEALTNDAVQSMDSVMDEVATEKLDENALNVAEEILSQPHRRRRQLTTEEHVAAVLKAGKLLDARQIELAAQVKTTEDGNRPAHEQAVARERVIVEQLDKLTSATRYSRTQIARALSIGRLRLSRESYDIVDILQMAQVSKGKKKLTSKERDDFSALSKEHAELVKRINELEKEQQAREWLDDQKLAQKVVTSRAPKGKVSDSIKKKARARQEYYKEKIRQMGLRVNDISGVTTEGSYFIGRLGLAYAEEGVGTLVGIAEKVRAAMPDLNFTQHDLNQALIMRSPREVAKARSEASKRVANLKAMARSLVKLNNLAEGISGEQRVKPEKSRELLKLQKMQSELEKRLRAEEKLDATRRGELPEGKKRQVDSPAVTAIKKETHEIQRLKLAEEKVVAARKGEFPEKRKKIPTPQGIKELQKEFTKLRNEFYKSDIDAAKLERAIDKVNRLQDQLANSKSDLKSEPVEAATELPAVNEQIKQLTRELRVDAELEKANEQLRTGEIITPIKRERKPMSPELERKEIQLVQKRREIRQRASDLAPWTAGKVALEVAYSAKAIAATADISFTMRQNLWMVFSHPIRSSKAFIPSIGAFFSEYSADRIQNSLLNSENTALYELSGLAIQDASSTDAQQKSEVFRARVIERSKLPGLKQFAVVMRASSRHAVTIGNLIRTSAFDQFIADNKNATMEEMRAMADYINVSTGLGNLNEFGAIGGTLQVVFFSPRFAVSRIQTPWKLAKYYKLPRVRKQIARDMVGVVATGGMVLVLAALAGAEVVWDEPENPDWGKIRIGNTRIDIWGGFQQPARVIVRIATTPFRKEAETGPLGLLSRFAAFKVSPAFSISSELLTGETAVGEETTRLETLARSVQPLILRDVEEAWREEGLPAAIGVGALAAVGIGVGTYKDSNQATRNRIKRLRASGQKTQAERIRVEFNKENPNNRIVTVKK